MKRLLPAILPMALLLGGCALFAQRPAPATAVVAAPAAAQAGLVERVPFRVGTSSATVDKLAAGQACRSEQGAGLVTAPGPVEIYRVACDDGRTWLARCELRQCRAL